MTSKEVTMWYNPIIRLLLRSPLHFFVSKNMMLMTYTGRRSGKPYTTPMSYLAVGDALYTISSRERVWWRNLRGGANVTLRLRGEDIPARAEAIEDQTEVAENLFLYLKTAPQLTRYMNVAIDSDGMPNSEDIARLAHENVVVRTGLK
jgi:deazaflavin-dependent oxidoreductase (nitroreductase family)